MQQLGIVLVDQLRVPDLSSSFEIELLAQLLRILVHYFLLGRLADEPLVRCVVDKGGILEGIF